MGLPTIEINFKQKAATAIKRSAKGVVAWVVKDATLAAGAKKEFVSALNIAGIDAKNETLLKSCFLGEPNKIIVVSVGADGAFEDAVDVLASVKFNWLVSNISGGQDDVVAYAKEKKCKALVYNATAPDDMHIVNFKNTAVKLADGVTSVDGIDYIVRIAGLLAGLPFTRSATYCVLTDLASVTAVETPVDGDFYLLNDGGEVRVARAVNSLTTLGENITSDMQKITTIEAMDLINEDIHTEFKNHYVGKYKNKYDNQALFLSAVRSYFTGLEGEGILNPDYDNTVDVNVDRQKQAWIGVGKDPAIINNWSDIQTKKNTFKTYIFPKGNILLLDAIEDMEFNIELF